MNKFFSHIRTYIFRGFLAVIPMAFCAAAVMLLYHLIDKRILVFLDRFFDVRQIPGVGILLLLVLLYFVGLITSNVLGRQFLRGLEYLTTHIPLVKHIYGLSKQMGEALSKDENIFKKPVLGQLSEC
jgi:uncharacterized membrane protein